MKEMINALNSNIIINSQEIKEHTKANEKYIDVTFKFENRTWSGWIPIQYRRTGVFISSDDEISEYILLIYKQMDEIDIQEWLRLEEKFWSTEKSRAQTTKSFFDVLSKGGWKCREHELPNNPNFARRIQDLKEFGYTISTDTNHFCPVCNSNKTHLILLPIPRVITAGNGYETWSNTLRKRILDVLDNYDVYEGKKSNHLLPDHKFSEIRWDDKTKELNPDTMTDLEIIQKFQLMTNQRNQQKREACRKCVQTGTRQCPLGIQFFYYGDENWDVSIPEKGKDAERGCIGCGWYDMKKWREELSKIIINSKTNH